MWRSLLFYVEITFVCDQNTKLNKKSLVLSRPFDYTKKRKEER